MAIRSIGYSFMFLGSESHSTGQTQSDTVGLSNGQQAVIATRGNVIDLDIRNAFGILVSSTANIAGTDGAVTQLTNGNIVVTSTATGGGINYTIVTSGGSVVSSAINITGNASDSNTDVAALTGGSFVLVEQRALSATDNDIRIIVRDSTGAAVANFPIATGADWDCPVFVDG